MDYYVARAMQVAYMSQDDIRALHAHEDKRGYCLNPFDIQHLFGIASIKETWMIPDDDNEAQVSHSARVKSAIDRLGLTRTDYGFPGQINTDATHAFDWAVSKNTGNVDFVYSGPTKRSRRLSDVVQ